jgi:hypothetical protein
MSGVVAPADQFPAGPLAVSGSVPRQLPVDVAHFTGRDAELARLDALLTQDDAASPAAMVIAVIAGTAGAGKTALAGRWAHRVRDRFPDGQLFVNLRGYGPGSPMPPEYAASIEQGTVQRSPLSQPGGNPLSWHMQGT